MPKLTTRDCTVCGGTGKLPDENTGGVLLSEREKAGIARRALADAMGISQEYLRDLEKGNRNWSNELVSSYQSKLAEVVNG